MKDRVRTGGGPNLLLSGIGHALGVCGMLLGVSPSALADQGQDIQWGNQLQAQARLDFIINMGKFLFFRIGTGNFPNTNSTVDTATITLTPTIPAAMPPITLGNSVSVDWNGTAPGVIAGIAVVPVEIRSNAGPISIKASVAAPLSSGGNTIPMSAVSIASTDIGFPAPPVPNSGSGTSVNVAGTAFQNRVTLRNANWNFSISPPANAVAGAYSGQITFTATSL